MAPLIETLLEDLVLVAGDKARLTGEPPGDTTVAVAVGDTIALVGAGDTTVLVAVVDAPVWPFTTV